jgi:hypothetical protein
MNVIGFTTSFKSLVQNGASKCKNHSILEKVCKQMPKTWYNHIDTHLKNHKIQKCHVDYNLYFDIEDAKYIIIFLYIDDLLIINDDEKKIQYVQEEFWKILNELFRQC